VEGIVTHQAASPGPRDIFGGETQLEYTNYVVVSSNFALIFFLSK
jgi:hypothetical protein